MLAHLTDCPLSSAIIKRPRQSRDVNLRELGLYVLVYNHVRSEWADRVQLKPDTATLLPGTRGIGPYSGPE